MTVETFLRPRQTKKKISTYSSLSDLFRSVTKKVIVPPRRLSVPEWAADPLDGRYVNQPGAYVGPWKNETVPYMVEPGEMLSSTEFKGVAFCGPAQSGKTDMLIINWVGQSVVIDPQDMIIYSPTFTAARDFSMRRIDRLHLHTESVGKSLLADKDADNKFDKTYRSGMLLTLSYPSITELRGKPVGRVALTDYDAMDDDIGGEGNAFDLASKRTTTYGSYAMCLAESSPAWEITDYKKVLKGHEAPPTKGILALYNRGDRRRWHWPCPHCGSYFEGEWEHMKWDTTLESNMDRAESCYMECPSCFKHIQPRSRYKMNLRGIWLAEGEYVDEDGDIVGRARRSDIASFWLKGVAAGLTTWQNLVKTYLDAWDAWMDTADEGPLKKFFNSDMGMPYIPQNIANDNTRTIEDLMTRAEEYGSRKVPAKVRFLLGLVDVQKNAFVVQIIGVAPGKPYDLYLVDRFTIQYSDRVDPNAPEGKESFLWVKPGAYLDDWDAITEQVINRTYELDDDTGRRMAVKLTLCDSGGKAGVTANAYNFWRKLRGDGYFGRFHLVKGDATPNSPRARITYPDSEIAKSKSGVAAEIPVLMLNPNINKDSLDSRLDIVVPGEGMIHFPQWLMKEEMAWFFAELVSEIREPGKGWIKVAKRNEAWDLFYYAIGACASSLLQVEKLDWSRPPAFAAEWDKNPLVFEGIKTASKKLETGSNFDWASFGRKMA